MQDLTIRLVHVDDDETDQFDPAAGEISRMMQAVRAEDPEGLINAQHIEGRWRDSVWNLINLKLGESLPKDFGDALAHCEGDAASATRSLATKLALLTLPRQPSLELRTSASDPARRRVYVGSDDIQGEFNRALQAPELGAQRGALQRYGNPTVVPALGAQILFLDLWVDPGDDPSIPGVIGTATDALDARSTYYAAEQGVPAVATAAQTCFTVIPEILAATKIELGGSIEPLEPAVVARLLGSDLDVDGPTYAELFYLLRARRWLSARIEGSGPEAREVTSITAGGEDAGRPLRLVAWPRGGLSDAVFGDGRTTVVAFDALCEFMRFRGTPRIAGQIQDDYAYPRAELYTRDWVGDPARAAELQRAIVLEWYRGGLDDDRAAMLDLLQADLDLMERGERGSARSSWELAMRRLLGGDERQAIRAMHLGRP